MVHIKGFNYNSLYDIPTSSKSTSFAIYKDTPIISTVVHD